jgi:hypothetical protein
MRLAQLSFFNTLIINLTCDFTIPRKQFCFKDCAGPRLPTARATYPGSTSFCDGNSDLTVIRHEVSLGVICNFDSEPLIVALDYFFECASVNDRFDVRYSGDFGLEETHYTCGQMATFPAGSLSTNTQVLSSVSVITDTAWIKESLLGCFSFVPVPVTPSAPTSPPRTTSPLSPFPSRAPTVSPNELNSTESPTPSGGIEIVTPDPTSMHTKAPVAIPKDSPPAPPTASEDSSPNAGAIAGGSVAGVAVLAIIAFLFMRKKVPGGNHQKSLSSRADFSASETNTDSNTMFRESLTAPQSVVASPYSAASRSLATDAPVHSSPNRTSYTGTPLSSAGSYDVRFKDQARSVLGYSQSSAPMVVPGVPMTEAIPIAVALDGSAASGGSKNTIRSVPPGRRADP